MLAYSIRRLLLIIPTLFGIMVVNFAVIQFAPGGPVEQMIANIQGLSATGTTSRITGEAGGEVGGFQARRLSATDTVTSKYRGARGLTRTSSSGSKSNSDSTNRPSNALP